MRAIRVCRGQHGLAIIDPERVIGIVDMPAGRCSVLLDGGRQVIVREKARVVCAFLYGATHILKDCLPDADRDNTVEAPGEAGKVLDELGGVT